MENLNQTNRDALAIILPIFAATLFTLMVVFILHPFL